VENIADALSVSLIGLFMSLNVWRTGSIWFAFGFHAPFDYAALYIFGAPNSGNRGGTPIDTRLLSGTFHGPSWLTGGPLGVEANWLVFPVIALLFLIFDRIHRAGRPAGTKWLIVDENGHETRLNLQQIRRPERRGHVV
jgi:hypothetical protein